NAHVLRPGEGAEHIQILDGGGGADRVLVRGAERARVVGEDLGGNRLTVGFAQEVDELIIPRAHGEVEVVLQRCDVDLRQVLPPGHAEHEVDLREGGFGDVRREVDRLRV